MATPGRELTIDEQQRLLAVRRDGAGVRQAAKILGLSRNTVRRYASAEKIQSECRPNESAQVGDDDASAPSPLRSSAEIFFTF